ncbi:class F sortase [Streptomyces sp. NPDC001941]|uniref:class F sortase n=1 Tax=Streptomyces sp. NPDC001941 TaxID=3154659 RepID=UPI00332DB4E0
MRQQTRSGWLSVWGVVVLGLLVFAALRPDGAAGPPQPGAEQGFGTRHGAGPAERAAPAPGGGPRALPRSEPVRVRIPQIRVDAPLVGLGLDADGRLASPPEAEPGLAGWYAAGATPGEKGTAVIGGHVDVPSGRAVFYDLGALRKGMTVDVARADGTTAAFAIDAIEVYDADAFPDDKVYGDAGRPELRLITCGGGFDEKAHRYRGNVVVFAHLTGTSEDGGGHRSGNGGGDGSAKAAV